MGFLDLFRRKNRARSVPTAPPTEAERRAHFGPNQNTYMDASRPGAQHLLGYGIGLDPRRFMQQQEDLEYQQMLQAAAQGQAPSVAQGVLQQGLMQAQQQASASLAGQRGLSPGMAARMQAGTHATMAGQAGQQSAVLRAQEMANARGMLGDWLGVQQSGRQKYDLGAMDLQAKQEELRLKQQMARIGHREFAEGEKMSAKDWMKFSADLTGGAASAIATGGAA